ncbi:MAG: MBL-fold metallo-hydrolase superfamily [uncultured Gemmatimonadetes bacterium]|uniref:MBL-fold metallo-hydrolase superfamily n=1 Tax=uncultured Gemmatimonadota bacterium TaxID=203437 RepID=A0A6J4KKW6_9BACT|nr:MAG: MBL-fold metallo-hydrolase superfamily [uncultured Gemmatimonadota bacterium]
MATDIIEAPGVTRVDLRWRGLAGQVAAYLVAGGGDLAVIDCGPGSTLDALLGAMGAAGHDPASLTHLLVTHVHLDHAGAAGALLRAAPRARLYVHPRGARHLQDPSRLLTSAARIYGDQMDALWGPMLPVPAERVRVLHDGDEVRVGRRVLRALDTPGHAVHHHAYHDGELLFSGDAGGIRLDGSPYVRPPTPPPDIDVPAWRASIARMRALGAARILPTHFGGAADVAWHLDDLESRLVDWAGWSAGELAAGADLALLTKKLRARAHAEVLAAGGTDGAALAYEAAVPTEMMAAGLLRFHQVRS